MFELDLSLRPSSYEIHQHARRARDRAIGTAMRCAAQKIAEYLGAVGRLAAGVARKPVDVGVSLPQAGLAPRGDFK